jgi:hypothetical protein
VSPASSAEPALLAGLALAVIAVEAALVAPGHLLAAQVADAALVLLIARLALRDGSRRSERAAASILALRALALVPLIRVVSLGMPLAELADAGAVLVLAVTFAVAVVVLAPAAGIARRRLVELPLTWPALLAAAAGIPLGLLVYLAGAPALWAPGAAAPEMALGIAAGACAAVTQELVFRGAVQLTFQRVAGALGAVGATALFTASHIGAGETSLVLSYALAGLVFAHGVMRAGTLGGALAGHVLLALGAGALWPLLLGRTPPVNIDGTAGLVLWAAIVLGVALTLNAPRRAAARARTRGPIDHAT